MNPHPHFDGDTYEPALDHGRLSRQIDRVLAALHKAGKTGDGWRTLSDLSRDLGIPEASVSARIRDLRKTKFGGYEVERRRSKGGLHHYRLLELKELRSP